MLDYTIVSRVKAIVFVICFLIRSVSASRLVALNIQICQNEVPREECFEESNSPLSLMQHPM